MAEIASYNEMFYTNFEPKMANRYIMKLSDGLPAYMVKAASRPSIQFETVVLDHINIKRKLQGKGEWQDITVTLYDPIVPSAAAGVMDWIRLGHETLTGRKGYADFYKRDLDFYSLGPVGDKIEYWKIKGAFITSANFGQVDFSSNEPMTVELNLAMDYCVLEY